MNSDTLLKIVNGALRNTISAHGSITKQFIGSASKRITCGILGDLKADSLNQLQQELGKEFVVMSRKEYDKRVAKHESNVFILKRIREHFGGKFPCKINVKENK